jgi:double-GTPase-like protein
MNAVAPICNDKQCKVQVDGKCRLKHDPVESCSNYAAEKEVIDEAVLVVEEEPRTAPPVRIWSSEKMLLADLAAFARRRRVRNVALVGEEKVGKTTLLASIYGMYCKGPFADLTFAGSETLLAFARLQSFALLSSGRTSPTVPRTSRRDPVSFFHLALARARGEVVDLVIADRSGETYAAARTSTDLIPTLEELRQADRVCFLLDGGRLASKDQRTAYTRHFRQMINALHDNGALACAKDVEILSTKFDITRSGDDDDENVRFLDEYQARIVSDFKAKGLDISSYHICALPKADRSVGIVGMDDMILRWTAPEPLPDVTPRPVHAAPRQIDRLLSKL